MNFSVKKLTSTFLLRKEKKIQIKNGRWFPFFIFKNFYKKILKIKNGRWFPFLFFENFKRSLVRLNIIYIKLSESFSSKSGILVRSKCHKSTKMCPIFQFKIWFSKIQCISGNDHHFGAKKLLNHLISVLKIDLYNELVPTNR